MTESQEYVEKPVMMRTTAPNEQLSYCVFLIEQQADADNYVPQGSGFLVDVDSILYGVTARHVVQKRDDETKEWGEPLLPLTIRAIRDNPDGVPSSFRKDFASRWFSYGNMYVFHDNPLVDVAVFPTYRNRQLPEKTKALPLSWLQADELVRVGEDVHLFGFPGIYGYIQGVPVVRSGTICYKLSRHAYLLDVTSWHGDSGGLVCSKPYFGVPDAAPSTYQWQMGGKVIGLLQGYEPPTVYGLPDELEPFRVITSAQAIIEVFKSEAFGQLHDSLRAIAQSEAG